MAKRTLFEAIGAKSYWTYPHFIERMAACDSQDFYGEELNAFSDVMTYESQLYFGARGGIVGDLDVLINQKSKVSLNSLRRSRLLPAWVESEGVEFLRCRAKGILLIIHGTMFNRLVKAKAHSKLNMILVSSLGIPRYGTRRLLHRLSKKFKLPVYLLTDNSTWGYFEFSVMKRGLIGPDFNCSYTAVEDMRYLGFKTQDIKEMLSPEDWKRCKISWKSYWKKRLDALRKYPRFKSAAWQREFKQFEAQRGKFDVIAMPACLGTKKVIEHLRRKIAERDWLA